MSVLYVAETASAPRADVARDGVPRLSVTSGGIARWCDPTTQYLTWCLTLTNAADLPLADLAARFTCTAAVGSPASALSLTSSSVRGGPLRTWLEGDAALARSCPRTLAAWETLWLTGVFTGARTGGGSASVSFYMRSTGVELGAVSAQF